MLRISGSSTGIAGTLRSVRADRPDTPVAASGRRGAGATNIDTLRGLACLFLVGYHAALGATQHLDTQSAGLALFNEVFALVRMPLFSFLSGYVYAYRRATPGNLPRFTAAKIRRLLIPFVTMTIVFLAIRTIVPGMAGPTIADAPHALIFGYSQLWFLQSIMVVFVIVAVTECLLWRKPQLAVAVIMATSLILYFTPIRDIQTFSLGQAFYLLPFFAFGVVINSFGKEVARLQRLLVPVSAGLFAILLWAAVREISATSAISRFGVTGLGVGLTSLYLLQVAMPRSRALSAVGSYSFTIFLLHSIFIAVVVRVGPADLWSLLPIVFVVALAGPVLIELLVHRFAPEAAWVLGQRQPATRRDPAIALAHT
ncbi:acyltransferase [Sphingomonas rosea]|uniref:acyltransferase family protein n=1 Tax=Sphingomonas rosea TaxID=335605 RepID=UPI0031E42405